MNIDCLCPLHPLTAMALSVALSLPALLSCCRLVFHNSFTILSRFLLFTLKFPAKSLLSFVKKREKIYDRLDFMSAADKIQRSVRRKKENFELSMFAG